MVKVRVVTPVTMTYDGDTHNHAQFCAKLCQLQESSCLATWFHYNRNFSIFSKSCSRWWQQGVMFSCLCKLLFLGVWTAEFPKTVLMGHLHWRHLLVITSATATSVLTCLGHLALQIPLNEEIISASSFG